MNGRRAVLLIGSARPRGTSTSEVLGGHVLRRLADNGIRTRAFHVSRCQRPDKERSLLQAVDEADVLVIATPLYVDSLPYLLTRCLERIAEHRQGPTPRAEVRLLALVNCGFPEWEQTRTALDICRVFARKAGFSWTGGLGLGGGEAIAGRPLAELGRRARHVTRALDLAAEALIAGRPAPPEAQALLSRPMVPPLLYTAIGTIRWLRTAHRHGALRRLKDRPFASR